MRDEIKKPKQRAEALDRYIKAGHIKEWAAPHGQTIRGMLDNKLPPFFISFYLFDSSPANFRLFAKK